MDLEGVSPDELLNRLLQANAAVTDNPSEEASRAYVAFHTAVTEKLRAYRTTSIVPAASAAASPVPLDSESTDVFARGMQQLHEHRLAGVSLAGAATPGHEAAFVTPPSFAVATTTPVDNSFFGPGALPLLPARPPMIGPTTTTAPHQQRQTTTPTVGPSTHPATTSYTAAAFTAPPGLRAGAQHAYTAAPPTAPPFPGPQ